MSVLHKKNFGKNFGLTGLCQKIFLVKTKNDKKIRFWNFKNPVFLTNFDKFWATFCSNYDYEVILFVRSKIRFLSVCYTPKYVFYCFLIIFWPSKNLNFCDFSMPNLPYKCDLSWAVLCRSILKVTHSNFSNQSKIKAIAAYLLTNTRQKPKNV